MDFLNTLATINQTTWLLIGGIALLVVNIIYGWVRSSRGNVKAGWFTVVLALAACALIGVGAVQAASANVNALRGGGQFAGRGTTFNNQAGGAAGGTNATSTASIVPVNRGTGNGAQA